MEKSTLKSLFKSKQGFSLVEVMVAAGLLGVVSLTAMNAFQNANKVTKKAKQDVVIEAATSRLQNILNKASSVNAGVQTCQNTIVGGGGALQAPDENIIFGGADLGEGVSIDGIAANFVDGGDAARRAVNIDITFSVRRNRQNYTVTRTLQTIVATDAGGAITDCMGYSAQRIANDSTNDSCRLIFTDCDVQDQLNPQLFDPLGRRLCESLGGNYNDPNPLDNIPGTCDQVIVERQLDSQNLKLNGSDGDQICLSADGGNCRVLFDNTTCATDEHLRGMGVAGEGAPPNGKDCRTLIFPTSVVTPPGVCPEQAAPNVANCTLPQTLNSCSASPDSTCNAANEKTVVGMCENGGTCSARCAANGSWVSGSDTGSCSPPVPSVLWCNYDNAQTTSACNEGKIPSSMQTTGRGLNHWTCRDASLSNPNDRAWCRTCMNNIEDVPDGSSGLVDIVDGSCQCVDGQTGSCTASCDSTCGCALNDTTCQDNCNLTKGWVVSSTTCSSASPTPLSVSLGSGGSPEIDLLWDASSNFIEKDGSTISSTANISLTSYISIIGGIGPYTASWTINDSTWQVTTSGSDPLTSFTDFTMDDIAGTNFDTQTTPDNVQVEITVTDSRTPTPASANAVMDIRVTRNIDCDGDFSTANSGYPGPGGLASCMTDYSNAKSACNGGGCYVYGEVVDADMIGGSTFETCNDPSSGGKGFQVECRNVQSSCAASSTETWNVAGNNCSLVGSSSSLPSATDGTIVTVTDDNTSGDGSTGSASFQCVGTTWREINTTGYPSSCAEAFVGEWCRRNDLTFTGANFASVMHYANWVPANLGNPQADEPPSYYYYATTGDGDLCTTENRFLRSSNGAIDAADDLYWQCVEAGTCSVGASCQNSAVPPITNGNFASSGSTADGATLNGTCDSGYNGTISANCNNGNWTTFGSCSPSICTNSAIPPVSNGTFPSSGTTASGSAVSGVCNSGYGGSISASCNLGNWTTNGSCSTSLCSNSAIPAISNGTFPSSGTTASGSSVTGSCNSGYDGSISATCSSGSWFTVGSCSPAECENSAIPAIANGTFTGSGTTSHSGSVSGTCNSGYTGSISATCSFGSWGTSGSCNAASCANSSAPGVLNGYFTTSGSTSSGSALIGGCNSGYSGSPSVTCTNGSFGSVSGSCTATSCANSSAPSGSLSNGSFPSSGTTSNGSSLSGSCNSGYTGSPSVTCSSGSFGSISGSCVSECALHNSMSSCESTFGSGNCKVIDGTVTTTSYYFNITNASISGWNCGGGAQPAEGACPTNSSSCPPIMAGSGGAVSCSNSGHVGNALTCYSWFDTGWTNSIDRYARRLTCTSGSNTPQQYTSTSCSTYSCTPDCSNGPGDDGCGGTCSFDCQQTNVGSGQLPYANSPQVRSVPDGSLCGSGDPRSNWYECTGSGPTNGWQFLASCCGGPCF